MKDFVDKFGNEIPDEAFENETRPKSFEELAKRYGGVVNLQKLIDEIVAAARPATNIIQLDHYRSKLKRDR